MAGEASFVFDDTTNNVGENLYASSSTFTIDSVLYGIQLWYEEYIGYNFDTGACSIELCGHYTELVWDNTRYVGCGVAICSPLAQVGFTEDAV
ncbi:MAG TPA: hypothetical protein EYN66_21230 [Myxococcales bacterium]|nr:hypothetical protein [Myxococcales bacterium]